MAMRRSRRGRALRIAAPVVLVSLVASASACAEHARPESTTRLAAKPTDQRADERTERVDADRQPHEETVDVRVEPADAAIDESADAKKVAIAEQANRSNFDTELRARLDKVDVRIADADGRMPRSKPASRAKADALLKSAREHRAALANSYENLAAVPEERWEPTKKEIETNIRTLEAQVDQLEELVAT
jgi:hypothetical protein